MADEHDAIRTVDMRVDYGDFLAVDGLTLSIPRGEVFGLVGPNGAGKTSSFKVLATLMKPTYGEVFLGGIDIAERTEEARTLIGYMPDLAPVPSDLKAWEFLDLFAAAHGIRAGERASRIEECLAEVQLEDRREAICENLSRGMKQRLVLAKTLLHRPEVLLLDEPASGMDPASRAALRGTVRHLANQGVTVLISSHILSELSDMCTSVGFMATGRLLDAGRVEAVVERQSRDVRRLSIRIDGTLDECRERLEAHPDINRVEAHGDRLLAAFIGDTDAQVALLHALIADGVRVRSFEEQQASIEDILLGLDAEPPHTDE